MRTVAGLSLRRSRPPQLRLVGGTLHRWRRSSFHLTALCLRLAELTDPGSHVDFPHQDNRGGAKSSSPEAPGLIGADVELLAGVDADEEPPLQREEAETGGTASAAAGRRQTCRFQKKKETEERRRAQAGVEAGSILEMMKNSWRLQRLLAGIKSGCASLPRRRAGPHFVPV